MHCEGTTQESETLILNAGQLHGLCDFKMEKFCAVIQILVNM